MLTQGTLIRLRIIALVDVAAVIWRKGRGSIWSVGDDREHLHYRLVDCGDAAEQFVKGVFLLCLILSGPGAFFYYVGVIESWSYLAFVLVCVGCFVVTNRLSQKT